MAFLVEDREPLKPLQEPQEGWAVNPEGNPMVAGRCSRASRFALEEGQHSVATIAGDHQGTALCRRPVFYVAHDLKA